MTAIQRDTLATALREGYFNVPRALTIEELSDVLGISSNAASQRIRRASDSLIQATIVIDAGESNDDDE
ncbi:helix-turn-helix domain-containing protein [Halocatena salina]|uniref:Helix-turn-helix domain-containing protein n=1 Tax=Halocatena salina TaxID=2934340 RepID=A0A8U0ABQ1_9EURY|nr:helix-turn-helix domain-containing protein [Halocatena salina]UPM45293.1 helix-turn-helix domain-containing protein [Halocatena salina]